MSPDPNASPQVDARTPRAIPLAVYVNAAHVFYREGQDLSTVDWLPKLPVLDRLALTTLGPHEFLYLTDGVSPVLRVVEP